MKKWLYAAAGILLAVGFAILGRDGRAAIIAGKQRDALILDKTKVAQVKAEKLGKKADKLQADAKEAAKVGQAAIDKVGATDENMRDVLDSWRSDSV